MNVNNKSNYYERLEYAEIAKIKSEYSTEEYKITENYHVKTGEATESICDLFIENTQTNEKVVFEVKAKRKNITKEEIEGLVRHREMIKNAIPGVKFFVRIIEEPKKSKITMEGVEYLLDYLIRKRHQPDLEEQIGAGFNLVQFKEVILTEINIKNEKIRIEGSACVELKFREGSNKFSDLAYLNFQLMVKDYFFPELGFLLGFFRNPSPEPKPYIDSHIDSKFTFDLQDYY